MDTLCKKFGYAPDKEKIDRSLEIIAANLENVISADVLKECFSLMDVTTLHTEDTVASVCSLVDKVNSLQQDYPEYPLPASPTVTEHFHLFTTFQPHESSFSFYRAVLSPA